MSETKSKWWSAYFSLVTVAFVASLLFGTHSPIRFITYIFNVLGLVGLWGYISDKAIGWRVFWAAYLAVAVVLAALNFVPSLWDGLQHDLPWLSLLLVAVLIELPGWVALWRYAFRSPHIWRHSVAA